MTMLLNYPNVSEFVIQFADSFFSDQKFTDEHLLCRTFCDPCVGKF